jgi:hypothetical protein
VKGARHKLEAKKQKCPGPFRRARQQEHETRGESNLVVKKESQNQPEKQYKGMFTRMEAILIYP